MRSIFYASFFMITFGLLTSPLSAQLEWSNAGPDNLGHIIRTIAFDNNNNLLAGAQGGGLWRSTDEGESWSRVAGYDQAGLDPNVTAIAVSGNTIVVGTGATAFTRPYARTSLGAGSGYDFRADPSGFTGNLEGIPGGGVYVSTDNGETWTKENATNTGEFAQTLQYQGPFTTVQKIAVNNGRIFIGTLEGLYYSDDNLQTVKLAEGSEFLQNNVIFDIEIAAGNRIFTTAHDDFSQNDSLYVSTDNGATFTTITDESLIVSGRLSFLRTEIAVSPSDPNIVYVATTSASGEVNGVFRKNFANEENAWESLVRGGGSGFSPLGTTSQDALALAVFPDDPNSVILAGFNWYTYDDNSGWIQRAQAVSPYLTFLTEQPYIPRNMYTVIFDPNDPNTFFVGTSNGVYASKDRGASIAGRTKGLEAMPTYSVAATYVDNKGAVDTTIKDAIFASTSNSGIVENSFYNTQLPSRQAFGQIWPINYSRIASSIIYPGALVAQNSDGGIVRSVSYGEAFETFYNIASTPQVANLTPEGDTLIDRANSSSQGGSLLNNPTPAQTVFVLDEYIPESLIDNPDVTQEELQAQSDSYIFFCSQNYVWLVQNGLTTNNSTPPRWNRITPALVDGLDEVFSAITVSGDSNHTVFVATNKGNIYRIDRAHDLANFDADKNITQLNADFLASNLAMPGRWISDLALDPNNPNRLVLTFAGLGAVQEVSNRWLWATDSAYADTPVFANWIPSAQAGYDINEPIYSAEYVVDPNTNESVLLLGSQSGLYSIRKFIRFEQGSLRAYLVDVDNGGSVTEELPNMGDIPVYDIFERTLLQTLNAGSLTRTELRPVTQGDTTVLQPFNVSKDQVILTPDRTLYIATHGRGIWTSTTYSPQRGSKPDLPNQATTQLVVRVYPNPASTWINLRLGLPGNAQIVTEVFDLQGRRLMQNQHAWQGGWQEASYATDHLSPGVYLMKISIEGADFSQEQTQKILIRR